MTLPVWWTHFAGDVNFGGYVAAETPERARSIGQRGAHGAGFEVRYLEMRARRCRQEGKPAVVEVGYARALATYEVEQVGNDHTCIYTGIDPVREGQPT